MMSKIKKKSRKQLKDKAWKAFSLYIRMKDADSNGKVRCITCGCVKHYKEMQASHFIDGRTNAVLFEERGVHPACYACNVCKHGNKVEYFRFMQEKYGDDVIDELRANAKQILKISDSELIDICNIYTQKVKDLENERNK